jgi:hypothetical protein
MSRKRLVVCEYCDAAFELSPDGLLPRHRFRGVLCRGCLHTERCTSANDSSAREVCLCPMEVPS